MAVMGLSRDAELAHRRLANLILSDGRCLAADHAKTAEIARVPPDLWPAVLEELRGIGWRIRGDRFTHPAVLALHRQARDACAGRPAISAAGSRARWHPDGSPDPIPSGVPSGLQIKIKMKNKSTDKAVNTDERLTFSSSTREQPREGEPRCV